MGYSSEEMLANVFETSTFYLDGEEAKLKLVPSRLSDIATFDIVDKDGNIIVEEGRRITSRHIRQLEKSGIEELAISQRLHVWAGNGSRYC